MSAQQHQHYITVEEYLEIERNSPEVRYEYDNGRMYMMSGGTIDHATIGGNIFSYLRSALRGKTCRTFTSDPRVRISAKRYVHPDVTVTCDEKDRGQVDIISSPRVVIEVLSPGTEMIDRREKLQWYKDCPSVQEYALVNTYTRLVELYRRGKNDLWSFLTFKPESEVELISIGVSIPMSIIYEDVVLQDDDGPALA